MNPATRHRTADAGGGGGRQVPELKSSFDQLIANCPLPVLLLDEDLVITDLSHRAELELDQPRKRRGLLEGLESNELESAARQAMETLKPAEITVRLYAAGRRPYHARLLPYQSGRKTNVPGVSAERRVHDRVRRAQVAIRRDRLSRAAGRRWPESGPWSRL